MFTFEQIEAHDGELADIFREMCKMAGIDPGVMEALLGCECPYGLLGYLSAPAFED